jgi:hypothetical protein
VGRLLSELGEASGQRASADAEPCRDLRRTKVVTGIFSFKVLVCVRDTRRAIVIVQRSFSATGPLYRRQGRHDVAPPPEGHAVVRFREGLHEHDDEVLGIPCGHAADGRRRFAELK